MIPRRVNCFSKPLPVWLLFSISGWVVAENFQSAQTGRTHPTVWMGVPAFDNGKLLRKLFEKTDTWKETRSVIDVLSFADHQLNRQFTDDELRGWFSQMQQWHFKLALEVGAIKP